MENNVTINVANDFSRFPAGRTPVDSKYSGEAFRSKFLEQNLANGKSITIELDGPIGYGSSFLEEAFGGLVRKCGYTFDNLKDRLHLISYDESLIEEIWSYIRSA